MRSAFKAKYSPPEVSSVYHAEPNNYAISYLCNSAFVIFKWVPQWAKNRIGNRVSKQALCLFNAISAACAVSMVYAAEAAPQPPAKLHADSSKSANANTLSHTTTHLDSRRHEPTSLDLQTALMEMMKFKRVDPQRSLTIINEYQPFIHLLTPEHQLSWHLAALTVFHGVNQLPNSARTLQHIAALPVRSGLYNRNSETLMHLGHYFIKTGQYNHAVSAYVCSVNLVDSSTRAIPMIYAMAVSFKLSGDVSTTREILTNLLRFLSVSDIPRWSALVEEALGILAMEQGEYQLATAYFMRAMDKQQMSAARAKELNVILNLLLTFALSEAFDKYARLEPRAMRLNRILHNQEKHIFLDWIQATKHKQQYGELTQEKRRFLQQRFGQLQSGIMRAFIRNHMVDRLNIEVPPEPESHDDKNDMPKLDNLLSALNCPEHSNALIFVDQYLSKIAFTN